MILISNDFWHRRKCIILAHTMYCWLLLQIYLLRMTGSHMKTCEWMTPSGVWWGSQDPPSGPNVPLQPSLDPHRTSWTLKRTCPPPRASSSAWRCSSPDSSSWVQVRKLDNRRRLVTLRHLLLLVTVSLAVFNSYMWCSGHFDPETSRSYRIGLKLTQDSTTC